MKKFIKITLILSGSLLCVGIVCLLGAFALGLDANSFRNMVYTGKFSFDIDDFGEHHLDNHHSDTHHIGFGSNGNDCVTIDAICKSLDIEVGTGSLKIYYDDVDKIQIEQKDMPGFESYIDEQTLCIESSGSMFGSSDGALTVVIPRDMHFMEVDLEIGASQAEVNGLIADSVSINVGAGEAKISGLDSLDLDVEVGVGEVEIELTGGKNDYNYSVECGVGSVKVGADSYAGMGTSKVNTNIGAKRCMDVECGIGEVTVSFLE